VIASPDGRTLASWGEDDTIKLWDVATARERATLREPARHDLPRSMVLSPDGKLLASAGDDSGEIRLWEVATGSKLAALAGHRGHVHCLAFSADGKALASGGSDHTLRLWDVASRTGRVLRADAGEALCVAFCCGGDTLASAGEDTAAIELWDVAGGHHRTTLRGHCFSIFWLVAGPDGKVLASSDGLEVKLWDAAAGKEMFLEAPRRSFGAGSLRFGPDGKTLAAIAADKAVEFWDVTSGKSTAWRPGDADRFRPVPPAPLRALLGIHPKLAEVYAGFTEEETGIVDSVLFAPGGAVFAVGRDDADPLLVKLWKIHPVQWTE
jgi:WD40 repeat protein